MTSQIVEEQTDFVEERMIDFDRKFTNLGVIVGLDNDGNKVNYQTTDVVKSWIRSFASTLIERVGSDIQDLIQRNKKGSGKMQSALCKQMKEETDTARLAALRAHKGTMQHDIAVTIVAYEKVLKLLKGYSRTKLQEMK